MGIGMNTIGNYSPHNISNTNRQPNVKQAAAKEVNKKDLVSYQEPILAEEKDFFTKLYPQNTTEITDYHFYQRNGKLSGVKLGSLIDRRG